MTLPLLGLALAIALVVPAASAVPPVCLEREAGALGTTAHLRATCGPQVAVTHCPPAGDGPCRHADTDRLLP